MNRHQSIEQRSAELSLLPSGMNAAQSPAQMNININIKVPVTVPLARKGQSLRTLIVATLGLPVQLAISSIKKLQGFESSP